MAELRPEHIRDLKRHFESPAAAEPELPTPKKVRYISVRRETVKVSWISGKRAEACVAEGTAWWISERLKSCILFDSQSLQNLLCQMARKAAVPPEQVVEEISEWVRRQGGHGPADPLSWLHGVLCFWSDGPSSKGRWVEKD